VGQSRKDGGGWCGLALSEGLLGVGKGEKRGDCDEAYDEEHAGPILREGNNLKRGFLKGELCQII